MELLEGLKTETVDKLTLRTPVTVDPSATVREAVQKMRAGKLGCAIVAGKDQKPVGIFTEAMLRHLLVSSPADLDSKVESAMAETYPWVNTTDTIELVLDAMENKNTRFVAVVDADGKVVGLTGQKGLMEYIAEYFPGEVMVQRIGSKPYPSSREGA